MTNADERAAASPLEKEPRAPLRADAMKGHSELAFLVQIHEQIKTIVKRAEAVQVAAINASVASRGGDAACAGFRAAATDLRAFSGRLSEEMRILQAVIAHEVHSVAILQSQRRRMGLLQRVSGPAKRRLAGCMEELGGQVEGQTTARQEIIARLNSTRAQCKQGQVAARTALFEAAHAGARTPVMRAAALGIEHLVEGVFDRATHLENLLEGTQS